MLIATDPLSLVFMICFLVGLLYLLITTLLGNLGHGHMGGHHLHLHIGGSHATTSHAIGTHATNQVAGTHATQTANHAGTNASGAQGNTFSTVFSYVNITSIILFLIGFGLFGYVFNNAIHLTVVLTMLLALAGGIVVAGLILSLLTRMFGDSEGATIQDVSDRTGLLGKVSITIQEGGLGEVIYVSPGGMRKSVPARSLDGRRLERDQEVVVINYQHGIAEVETWEHFIEEEEMAHGSPPVSNTELEKLRLLLNDSDSTDAELVMRKDPLKE